MLLPMVSVSPSVAVALAHMVAPVIRYSESRAPSPRLCDAASCSVADLKNLLVGNILLLLGKPAERVLEKVPLQLLLEVEVPEALDKSPVIAEILLAE